ncbi:hypothetical protein AKJ38_02405 [candidate division MSBL1 archaeon SCGC-AAA259I14]|uniref:Response regulatory domain-containing protein n=1 Tax=candidate division MSBL1 archaeon SCGC-AAA259I14 TaxID=1698268 RepID=A0A133URY9_9EURY|nr:hypothetical protein AKJ38_02405 [candidate division MSBL1 archaeon SCGC-AAA259I14]
MKRNEINILFVDDETDFCEQAEIFLERKDDRLNVDTSTSAKDALEAHRNNNYDAIISDYKMPDMNGIELLEALREEDEETFFLILTGKGDEEVAMEALNLGADRYLRKTGEEPKMLFDSLVRTVVSEIERYHLKKREEYYQSMVGGDLKEKIKKVQNQLQQLMNLELPKQGKKLLKKAIETTESGIGLTDKIVVPEIEEPEETVKSFDREVLIIFLENVYLEASLEFLKLWAAYKKIGKYRETIFKLMHNSAKHRTILEEVRSKIKGVGEMEPLREIRQTEFDFEDVGKDEIFQELADSNHYLTQIYEKLLYLADENVIKQTWKGDNPKEYFQNLKLILEEKKKQGKILERIEKLEAFGIGERSTKKRKKDSWEF